MTKNAGKHLTLSDRLIIEELLNSDKKLKDIAKVLDRDPRGIVYEIRHHRMTRGHPVVECLNVKDCAVKKLCGLKSCLGFCKYCGKHKCSEYCPHYKNGNPCKSLQRFPYVCNACESLKTCRLHRYVYSAKNANDEYRKAISESKRGIRLSREELTIIDEQIYQDVAVNGQSVAVSIAKNKLNRSAASVYAYIHGGILKTKTIDLPRAVRYRVRRRKTLPSEHKVNYDYLEGRRIEELGSFLMEHPGSFFWQMDTCEGPERKAGPGILTLLYSQFNLQLMFRINRICQSEVLRVFREIRSKLGTKLFAETFSIILTDNGSEFKDPLSLETDPETGERDIHIFFCHSQASDEKAECEANHAIIRRIVERGTSWIPYTEDDINHISLIVNNYPRPMLNFNSPYQAAEGVLNKKVLDLNKLHYVANNEVKLKPLKK